MRGLQDGFDRHPVAGSVDRSRLWRVTSINIAKPGESCNIWKNQNNDEGSVQSRQGCPSIFYRRSFLERILCSDRREQPLANEGIIRMKSIDGRSSRRASRKRFCSPIGTSCRLDGTNCPICSNSLFTKVMGPLRIWMDLLLLEAPVARWQGWWGISNKL